jgi:hypothetical protein
MVQGLIEKAANFNLWTGSRGGSGAMPLQGNSGAPIGVRLRQPIHRLAIDTPRPAAGDSMAASNAVGDDVGRLELRLVFIPHDHRARPDREPPPTALDRELPQRCELQEAVFTLGDGHGFRAFGTGRTAPMVLGGVPRLTLAAVGDLAEGFGRFSGLEGNLVLCGDLDESLGLDAHVMVRIGDPAGRLERFVAPSAMPSGPAVAVAGTTFLSWVAEKGSEGEHRNFASTAPDGRIRGFNIPVGLRRIRTDLALDGPGGFRSEFTKGPSIGLEIGFGRETAPRTPGAGGHLHPFQFEGVSKYFFHDAAGRAVGTCTANFYEGRSFAIELPGLGRQPALRFAYYGNFVDGSGCFAGIRGFLYGLGRSLFDPTRPADHVISNLYVARLSDPRGRYLLPGGGNDRSTGGIE